MSASERVMQRLGMWKKKKRKGNCNFFLKIGRFTGIWKQMQRKSARTYYTLRTEHQIHN